MLELFQLMLKKCIKNMGILQSFEKNESATMFSLKKPSLVLSVQSKQTTKGNRILEYRKTSRPSLQIVHFITWS